MGKKKSIEDTKTTESEAINEKKPKKSLQSAESLAKAMAANMVANQADPDWDEKRMERQSRIAAETRKEFAEKEQKKKALEEKTSKALEEKAKKDAQITAQGIAEAMAANMTANQADPNWESEHEQMASEVAKKVFKKGTKENPPKETLPTAKETAEAMMANLTANQADPDFELKHEQQNAESADFAIKKNAKKLAEVGIRIPGYTENGEKMDKKNEKKKPETDPKKK